MRRALGGRPPVLFEATPAEGNGRPRLETVSGEQAANYLPATNTSGYLAWITMSCCTSSGGTEDHLRSTVHPAPT
jgi:hypothetical protein